MMTKLSKLGIIGGAALLTATLLSFQWSQNKLVLSVDSADAQVYGYGYPTYSYGYPAYSYGGYGYRYGGNYYPAYSYGGYGYGYPAYSYGGYYRPALYGAGYLGYRVARRVAIHRAALKRGVKASARRLPQ
jgi:hypothetical protein